MDQPIKVLLVDDHDLAREGLRRVLEMESDIQMPGMNGIELTRYLTKIKPDLKILVLTLYEEYLPDAIGAGAVGYLRKDLGRGELTAAIRTAHEGRSPIYLNLDKENLLRIVQGKAKQEVFSEREKSIMQCVASGEQGKEIAEHLAISQTTVRRTLRQVFNKLGARNSSEAVSEAYKQHLI